ncbi:MAG: hypothetical protein C0458_05805 [Methylobacterium sp.]|nr:hypothetical protein [Methylobacterium sp.]
MARFTDKLRIKSGVRDGDPVAPVFDAIDDLHGRVEVAEAGYDEAAAQEAESRRRLIRDGTRVGLVVAVVATGLAFAAAAAMIRMNERRGAEQFRALDEERTRSFDARVEKRAAEIAYTAVAESNGRAASAEAQLEVARGRLAALAGNANDEIRVLVRLSATAPPEDLALLRKLLRHQDPNVRRTCDALMGVSPAMVSKLLDHFTANKGRL